MVETLKIKLMSEDLKEVKERTITGTLDMMKEVADEYISYAIEFNVYNENTDNLDYYWVEIDYLGGNVNDCATFYNLDKYIDNA